MDFYDVFKEQMVYINNLKISSILSELTVNNNVPGNLFIDLFKEINKIEVSVSYFKLTAIYLMHMKVYIIWYLHQKINF